MPTLTEFWKTFGGELAKRWVTQSLTPAIVFWLGGLLAWSWHSGFDAAAQKWLGLSVTGQVAGIVVGLLIVSLSAVLVEPLQTPALRLLEGYWPRWLNPIRRCLTRRHEKRRQDASTRWQALMKKGVAQFNADELRNHAEAEHIMRSIPANSLIQMPTALGNILRAAEQRPRDKYGLESIVCWARLWLQLPEQARTDIAETRSGLNLSVSVWIWSLLGLLWMAWAWWAIPVGILSAVFAYRWALTQAEAYGEMLESCFDIYRSRLYEALRWPLPTHPADELATGAAVTQYLWRGSDASSPIFSAMDSKSSN